MGAGLILHASTVSLNGRAVVITGRSGAGKSALALQLMAMGCGLVADDRTALSRRDDGLWADCPPTIRGRIEARGIGILNVVPAGPARVALAVDLDATETERLPPFRSVTWIGQAIPLIHKIDSSHFPAAILQYLTAGRNA